jgi:hypothetical protein
MEQADIAPQDITVIREERAYEKYGWMVLSASAILGIFAALITTLPPISWFWNPVFVSAYSLMGAWGVTWVAFNILALVIIQIPYRKYERWSWYTLWMLPLLWLSHFAFSPDLTYLMLAALTMIGLVLPYRRFFTRSEEELV